MLNTLLNKLKRLNHDMIIYYVSFVFCLGIVFQGQSKIPLTFGIVFTSFFWLIKPNYKEKWERLKENKAHLFLILFYILLGASMLWSDDVKTFGRLIQLKLSLLLSTLVWSSTVLTKKQIHALLMCFVGAVALHLSLDLIILGLNPEDVGVHKFSVVSKDRKHYIALYALFSFGISNYFILNIKKKGYQLLFLILSLFFTYNILYIGSRIHIIGLFALSAYFIYQLFKANFSKKIINLSILGLVLTIGSVSLFSKRIHFKIEETKDEIKRIFNKTYKKNTNPRVYIWPEAIHATEGHLLFGHGLGDAQNELNVLTDTVEVEFWLNNQNTKLRDKNINAHSQYLEIILQVGVFGLLLFLMSLFFGLKKSNQLFIILAICVILSMLTESILERQFGLVFFAFFFPLLLEKRSEYP